MATKWEYAQLIIQAEFAGVEGSDDVVIANAEVRLDTAEGSEDIEGHTSAVDSLNGLGEQGWELVSRDVSRDDYPEEGTTVRTSSYFLKRPKD